MSAEKKPLPPPRRTASGKHPAVKRLYEETLPALEAETKRIESTMPPAAEKEEEKGDAQGGS